jgi:lysophospholipase L1-like esterase
VRISLGGRVRRLSVGLAALACVVTGCTGGESSASSSPSPTTVAEERGTYLALGDSVPFGFRTGAFGQFSDADNFVGYPELVADELGLDVVNASCPGETTASFLDAAAQSNGCQNALGSDAGYRTSFPLHVEYDSPDQSQLDFALHRLAEGDDVDLVTLQVGANDGFLCQRTTPSRCSAPADIVATAQTARVNLQTILSALRSEYDGQIVVVTYYALDYADVFGAATRQLDNAIAQVAQENGADVADGFAAFQPGAESAGGDSQAAGLVLPNDVHPTEQGQRLLAEAVLAVVED